MFAYAQGYGKLPRGGAGGLGVSRIDMSTLRTQRLLLRPLSEADVAVLHEIFNDPEVRRYLWDNQTVSEDTVREVLAESDYCFTGFGAGFYVIELGDRPGQVTGFCGFRRFEGGEEPELLYGIHPDYWGEGFVTEAASAVLRHGFEKCGMALVVAATDTPNQRSVRVLERLGMFFRDRREYRGLDTVFYGLSREDFAD